MNLQSDSCTEDRKFGELIVYLSHLSEGDDNFGSVKLNKLLFYVDFIAYQQWGRSVTGKEYQKLNQGPAPRALLPVFRELESEGVMVLQTKKFFGRLQKRPIALREAKLAQFTPDEIDLIHYVVDRCKRLDVTTISERSHRFIGWKVASLKETIPYEVALIGERELTVQEEEYGRSLQTLAAGCLHKDA